MLSIDIFSYPWMSVRWWCMIHIHVFYRSYISPKDHYLLNLGNSSHRKVHRKNGICHNTDISSWVCSIRKPCWVVSISCLSEHSNFAVILISKHWSKHTALLRLNLYFYEDAIKIDTTYASRKNLIPLEPVSWQTASLFMLLMQSDALYVLLIWR